jgi:hypothetical protein
MEGFIVVLGPVGLLEFLELGFDIISLILDVIEGFVVDVDTIWSLLDVMSECLEEFTDLVIEFLTLWGSSELLIELFNISSLFSAT